MPADRLGYRSRGRPPGRPAPGEVGGGHGTALTAEGRGRHVSRSPSFRTESGAPESRAHPSAQNRGRHVLFVPKRPAAAFLNHRARIAKAASARSEPWPAVPAPPPAQHWRVLPTDHLAAENPPPWITDICRGWVDKSPEAPWGGLSPQRPLSSCRIKRRGRCWCCNGSVAGLRLQGADGLSEDRQPAPPEGLSWAARGPLPSPGGWGLET